MFDLLLSTIRNLIYNLYRIKSRRLCPQKVDTAENVFQNWGVPCNYQVRDLVWCTGVAICSCLLVISVCLLVVYSRLFVIVVGCCVLWWFVVVCGRLLVVCGCLLVVCGRLLVVRGCLLVFCGRLLVIWGALWWFVVVACFSNYDNQLIHEQRYILFLCLRFSDLMLSIAIW